MKILFLHGWTSVPGGVKPTFLARHGHEVLNPKLPDDDFEEAVRIAQTEFDKHRPDVVVGSSRGGAVAMNVEVAGLEKMFFEVGVPVAQGATSAPPPTKEEIEKLLAVAPKYGIEIRLPGH